MFRIAIVDDEKEQRELLRAHLQRYEAEYHEEFQLFFFPDAVSFLKDRQTDYDIIFMDIQMPGPDGMTISRKLRARNQTVILIFITNMVQFAVEGYAVDAMDFIVKPVSYYRMASSLTKAKKRLRQERGVRLTIRAKEGVYCVDSSKVHYIEMVMHHTVFHTEEGTFDSTGSLKKLEEQLEGQDFARCNNGYLVNLRYVRAVEGTDVLVGEDRLCISRTRRKAFLQQLSEYFGGK